MANDLITVKGTRKGLVFYFNTKEGNFDEIHTTLLDKFKEANGFFNNAKFIIDEKNNLDHKQIQIIEEIFMNHGMTRGESNKKILPKRTLYSPNPGYEETESYSAVNDAVLIFRSLRSGQKIYINGDAVIMGDVNPGAQVIATGSIIIMGTFRGIAHAGVQGDDKAFVMACKLIPTQIAISDKITRSPEVEEEIKGLIYPEIAFIADNQIIVEPYHNSKKKAANF